MARVALQRHAHVLTEDLPKIYDHIAADNPVEANDVLDAIDRTFNLIAHHPECGTIYSTRHSKLPGVRMFPVSGFPKYLIFYKLEPGVARILYVLHGMRNLRRLFRRTPRA